VDSIKNYVAEQLDKIRLEEFRRTAGWSFDPSKFGFAIFKRWGKWGKLKRFPPLYPNWEEVECYWHAEKVIKKSIDGCNYILTYVCLIEKVSEKDYTFTLNKTIKTIDEWKCEPQKFEYNVPTQEVARIILSGLEPVDSWV